MYKYPYGDSQQLNLDWILAKIKELEASGASGGADLEEVSNALLSLTYNTSTAYRRYDYAFLNGKLYRCLTDTSGVFNPTAWQEALIGDDLAVLTRWINAIDAAAVVDVKFDTTGTNGKIQQKYHDQYHDVVEVDYTPVQNSKRPLSSNAGYELNGAITSLENPSTTFGTITKVIEGGTLARTTCYKRGRVVNVSGIIHTIANNDASEKIYFQISEGYRPTAQTYVIGYMFINNEPPVNVLAKIGTDGNVMLGYTSAAGVYANQVGFAGSYLV